MNSPTRFTLGVAAWFLAVFATVMVARLSDGNGQSFFDVDWFHIGATVIVWCCAFWGSIWLTNDSPSIVDGLGQLKFDALQHNSRFFGAALLGGGLCPALVKLFCGDYTSHLNVIGYVLTQSLFAFLILGNPWRQRLRSPSGGFAIHENGIRTKDRPIRFKDINSVSISSTPLAFDIELSDETVTLSGKMDAHELEEVMRMLQQECDFKSAP